MHTQVAIVGSGFGGLGAAIRLKQSGINDFVVLERADDVGGTWRDNTYPGCACDVESHLYSFSFALNADWTWRFSRQPEIWAYLQRCAREFGVLSHIRFNTEVRAATWDHEARRWILETSAGRMSANKLVMAAGPLSEPVVPELAGIETFRGNVFHSGRWDHSIDLTGRRVAVLGTGASAIQFVPEIQRIVGKLFLFQRTPPWVVPRPDRPIRHWQRRVYHHVPITQRVVRFFIYAWRELWVVLFRNPALMRYLQRVAQRHMSNSVADPALRAALTPNYTMGCKRILLSNDYYPAITQPNVEVVTAGIREVRAGSIVDRSGVSREIDTIIFGTGFRPTDPPIAAHIRGNNGRTLREAWAGTPMAHVGTTVAGFPNLFLLLGPNSGLGHNSVVYMAEAQIEHLLGALHYMRRHNVDAIEPKIEAQSEFVAGVDRRMHGTVWVSGGCSSWYLDRTGRNSTIWPDSSWSYYRRTATFRPDEYVMLRPMQSGASTPEAAMANA